MTKLEKNDEFPDQEYLRELAKYMRKQGEEVLKEDPLQAILVEAGRRLNWIADYLTDKNVLWRREKKFPIDQLTLTGTNASWNAVILDQCHGSPQELRKLFQTDSAARDVFASVKFADAAILVRFEEGKYFIFDGMNRVVAAIRDEKTTIDTFIVTPKGRAKPQCEAHVVYDFLRSYQRGINRDRAGLIAALQFLLNSYSNVKDLLRYRFGPTMLRDEELQEIIGEVLKKKTRKARKGY